MPEIPPAAIQAVMDHEWADWPRSAHSRHTRDFSCAVCQCDVPAILTVAAPALGEYIAALLDVHAGRLQDSARQAARAGHPDRADRHSQRAAAWAEAAHSARTVFAMFATGGEVDRAAIAEMLAKAQAGTDFIQDRVTLDRSLIECILLERVAELDDDQGCVDANLAELAYIYRQATGWDAKSELAKDLTAKTWRVAVSQLGSSDHPSREAAYEAAKQLLDAGHRVTIRKWEDDAWQLVEHLAPPATPGSMITEPPRKEAPGTPD